MRAHSPGTENESEVAPVVSSSCNPVDCEPGSVMRYQAEYRWVCHFLLQRISTLTPQGLFQVSCIRSGALPPELPGSPLLKEKGTCEIRFSQSFYLRLSSLCNASERIKCINVDAQSRKPPFLLSNLDSLISIKTAMVPLISCMKNRQLIPGMILPGICQEL